MNRVPLLSVVIPTYCKADLLRRTLHALACQEMEKGAWEVIVVDDGSPDHTREVLAEMEADFPVPLRVVAPGNNVGRARARNLGVEEASGTWVLFLDDDILAPPGLLAAPLELLAGNDKLGTIGYAVSDPDLVDAPHFRYLDTRGVARLNSSTAPARFFVTQNAVAPRWALKEIGGFDEEFSAYGFEDMELAFRLEDHCGISFRALHQPVPRHIHHHSLAQYLDKKVECGRHSLPQLARTHPQRLQQMRLHWIVDPDETGCPVRTALVRRILDSGLGTWPAWLAGHWPTRRGSDPSLEKLYLMVMNLAVLSCLRRGVTQSSSRQQAAI